LAKYYLLVYFFVFALAAKAQQKTIIEGSIISPYNEHASLALYKYINIAEPINSTQNLVDSNFKFQFELTVPAYFTLLTNKHTFKLFLIEPGDSIHIDMNVLQVNEITFSGLGSDKVNYQYWANIRYQDWDHSTATTTSDTGRHYFNYLDSCRGLQLYSLKNFKRLLTPTAYMVLYADVFYNFEDLKSQYIYNELRDSTTIEQAKLLYKLYLAVQKKFAFNDTLSYSRNVINYLIRQNEADYQYLHIKDDRPDWAEKYSLAQTHTKGKIRERVLAQLLMGKDALITETDVLKFASDYLNGPYNPVFKELIRSKYQLK
jgi:hypothetical protein